eukprot:2263245-Rhodomonas_salina.1
MLFALPIWRCMLSGRLPPRRSTAKASETSTQRPHCTPRAHSVEPRRVLGGTSHSAAQHRGPPRAFFFRSDFLDTQEMRPLIAEVICTEQPVTLGADQLCETEVVWQRVGEHKAAVQHVERPSLRRKDGAVERVQEEVAMVVAGPAEGRPEHAVVQGPQREGSGDDHAPPHAGRKLPQRPLLLRLRRPPHQRRPQHHVSLVERLPPRRLRCQPRLLARHQHLRQLLLLGPSLLHSASAAEERLWTSKVRSGRTSHDPSCSPQFSAIPLLGSTRGTKVGSRAGPALAALCASRAGAR